MNLRQQRTYKYNNIINKEWDSQLFTIENINLINYDNIKLFDAYHIDKLYLNIDHNKQYCNTHTFNYMNQYYEIYYYLTINKLIPNHNNNHNHNHNHNNNMQLDEEDDDDDENMFDKVFSIYELMKHIYLKRELFLIKKYKTYLATYKIQQWWKKIVYDPKKKFIHNIMNKQYDSYSHNNNTNNNTIL